MRLLLSLGRGQSSPRWTRAGPEGTWGGREWGSLGEPGQGLQAIALKGGQGPSVCLSDQDGQAGAGAGALDELCATRPHTRGVRMSVCVCFWV